jgi:hypothetical protein
MLKYLICLFIGHDYKLLHYKSFPKDLNQYGERKYRDMLFVFYGFRTWVMACKKCGKISEQQTLGE